MKTFLILIHFNSFTEFGWICLGPLEKLHFFVRQSPPDFYQSANVRVSAPTQVCKRPPGVWWTRPDFLWHVQNTLQKFYNQNQSTKVRQSPDSHWRTWAGLILRNPSEIGRLVKCAGVRRIFASFSKRIFSVDKILSVPVKRELSQFFCRKIVPTRKILYLHSINIL